MNDDNKRWVSAMERQRNFVPLLDRKTWKSPGLRQQELQEKINKQNQMKKIL